MESGRWWCWKVQQERRETTFDDRVNESVPENCVNQDLEPSRSPSISALQANITVGIRYH